MSFLASFFKIVGRTFIGIFFIINIFYAFFLNWDKTLLFTKNSFPILTTPAVEAYVVLALIALSALCLICDIFPKIAAFILVISLGTFTVLSHNFWAPQNILVRADEALEFFKNMAIVGGLLLFMCEATSSSRKKSSKEN